MGLKPRPYQIFPKFHLCQIATVSLKLVINILIINCYRILHSYLLKHSLVVHTLRGAENEIFSSTYTALRGAQNEIFQLDLPAKRH
jgi:hypothetical protein